MKYFVALAFVFVQVQSMAQVQFQIKLLRNQLRGAPIEGVQITGDESVIKSIYKGDGKYELRIDDKKPGELLTLNIQKKNFTVVNYEWLRITIPDPSNKTPTNILLCLEGERDKWREIYYQLLVRQNFNVEKDKLLKNQSPKLPGKKDDGQHESSEFDPVILDQIVHSIATTKPEEVDEEYNRAFASFINHDYERAKSILDPERRVPEQYAILQASRRLRIELQKVNKKLELSATIAISEANVDLAIRLYATIARSDSSNLSVVLNLVSFLCTRGNFAQVISWIDKTESVIPQNSDDSLRKLYLAILKRGLLNRINTYYLDSLEHQLPSIASSPGLLSAGLYSVIGIANLAHGREANGLQLLRKSYQIVTPEFRAPHKIATLLLLLSAYKQNKNREDSLFQELISVSRSEYVKDKSLSNTVLYLNSLIDYAQFRLEDNKVMTPLLSSLIQSYADDNDDDDDKTHSVDSCRLFILDLYNTWSQHTYAKRDKYRLAELIKGDLEAEFIPDSLLSVVIYQGLNSFQDIYPVYKDDPSFISEYSDFLENAQDKLDELKDRPKLKELVWQRFAIQQEQLELLPFQRRTAYASAIWPILKYQITYENPAIAEAFLDSLSRQMTARSNRDSNYLFVTLAIYEYNLSKLVDALWKTDTTVYTRWEPRYFAVLRNSRALDANGTDTITTATGFVNFEKTIRDLRSDTLYHLYRNTDAPDRKLQICQQALAELRISPHLDIHFEFQAGGDDNQVNAKQDIVNWLARSARANIIKKDFKSAQDSIDHAFQNDSTSAPAMVTQAHIYWLTSKFTEAEGLYEKYKKNIYISDGYAGEEGTKYITREIDQIKAAGVIFPREEQLRALLGRK